MPDPDRLESLRIERPRDEPARPRRGGRWVVVAVVVAAVAAAAVWWLGRERPVEVAVATVRAVGGAAGAGGAVLNASGYVTARRQATVSSKVTGKVVEVLVDEGMEVAEGQVLARLDDSIPRAQLALAEAQLAAAEDALTEAEVLLADAERVRDRVERLAAGDITSRESRDAAAAAAAAAAARMARAGEEVSVARQQVALRRQELDDTVIRAPFAGVAISKDAQPGEMISPVSAGGGFTRTGIGTIVDMESLEIEVDVSESFINRVEPGQRVEAVLDSYPDWRIPAEVITTVPAADRQKATVKVRVKFDRLDPRILPDMGVKVAFLAEPEADGGDGGGERLVVPRVAVRRDGDADVVYRVTDGRVERRAVAVGAASAASADGVEVRSGLAAGDRVVTEARGELADGVAVRIVDGA